MTSGESFRRSVREGRRAGNRAVVVHLLTDSALEADPVSGGGPRVGFVVGRSVGGAVVRNRVRRRLRHLVREVLTDLPRASSLVVRALPAAADASYAELRDDLGRCLVRVLPSSPAGTQAGRHVSTS